MPGSPTSVSNRQPDSAYVPGRVTDIWAWTDIDCNGSKAPLNVTRPQYAAGSDVLRTLLVNDIWAMGSLTMTGNDDARQVLE